MNQSSWSARWAKVNVSVKQLNCGNILVLISAFGLYVSIGILKKHIRAKVALGTCSLTCLDQGQNHFDTEPENDTSHFWQIA